MKPLTSSTSALWEKICTKCNRAVVFIDNPSAEILHWHGGFKRLVDGGAAAVKEFSSFESADTSQKKAVFIVSSVLQGVTTEIIKDIVQASSFQYVIVITCASPQLHHYYRTGHWEGERDSSFEEVEEDLLHWMGNMNYTTEVHYIPLSSLSISNSLFVCPGYQLLFPLLDSDLNRIKLQYQSSKGERRNFASLKDVEMQHLPTSLQLLYKSFVSSVNGMLEELGVNEDCYSLGHTSRILATELANHLPAKNRRKNAQSRASILFVDRTLDLAATCNHQSEALLDKIVSLLPRLPGHGNDVMVDMTSVCKVHKDAKSAIVPGCLSSTSATGSIQGNLKPLIYSKQKEALMEVNRQLVEAASRENLPLKLTGRPGRITPDTINSTVQLFKQNYKAIATHLDTLQVAMATVQTLQHSRNSAFEDLGREEKLLQQSMGSPESPSPLLHLQKMLQHREKEKISLDDLLVLLVQMYSLLGEELIDTEEEEQVMESFIQCFMEHKDNLPPLLEKIVGNTVTEEVVRAIVDDVWEKLKAVGQARNNLVQLGSILEGETALSPTSYRPLLSKLVHLIFDPAKVELKEVEHKSSGFTELLKSGFGLFRSVTSKPRPNDHPLLIIFVVGGITASEAKQVKDVLTTHETNTQVLIGSTRLCNSSDIVNSVFSTDNVNPAILKD